MSYIQSEDHLLNYFRKIFRQENIDFSPTLAQNLLNFYQWSKHYTGGSATDNLTWALKNKISLLSKKYLENFSREWIESHRQEALLYKKKELPYNQKFVQLTLKLQNIAGVYFLYNKEKKLLYVGRSFGLGNRVFSSIKERLSGNPHWARFLYTKTKSDTCILEAYFIGKEKPIMNGDMANIEDVTLKIMNIPKRTPYLKIFNMPMMLKISTKEV